MHYLEIESGNNNDHATGIASPSKEWYNPLGELALAHHLLKCALVTPWIHLPPQKPRTLQHMMMMMCRECLCQGKNPNYFKALIYKAFLSNFLTEPWIILEALISHRLCLKTLRRKKRRKTSTHKGIGLFHKGQKWLYLVAAAVCWVVDLFISLSSWHSKCTYNKESFLCLKTRENSCCLLSQSKHCSCQERHAHSPGGVSGVCDLKHSNHSQVLLKLKIWK